MNDGIEQQNPEVALLEGSMDILVESLNEITQNMLLTATLQAQRATLDMQTRMVEQESQRRAEQEHQRRVNASLQAELARKAEPAPQQEREKFSMNKVRDLWQQKSDERKHEQAPSNQQQTAPQMTIPDRTALNERVLRHEQEPARTRTMGRSM